MQQIIRYGLVGVATNALAYVAYLLLTHGGVPPKTAMTAVYLLAAFAGYWGNRQLTFAHRGSVLTSGTRYVVAHALGYALNWTLLAVLVDRLGHPHQLVQAFAIVAVACLLFVMFRFFVFAEATQAPPREETGSREP